MTRKRDIVPVLGVMGGKEERTLHHIAAMSQPKKDAQGDTIGEGNYDASRRYRQGLEESVKKGDAADLAEKAKEALDGKEGDELREAEAEGKRGPNVDKE